ncbi:MAG: ABC transporter permease [Deltaproteobacteria bacterium]|jgi:putative ABC transport system permease protein|nr:ABC transporter permease [Deltaproteobacteria bacterium]
MKLKDIALRNIRRRKAKAGFVLAGLLIAVSTAVALLGLIEAMNRDIQQKLEEYGANILVLPRTENLSLTYGGLSLGGVSFEMQEIRQADLGRIKSIKNAANVAATGPMVLGAIEVNTRKVLLAGVDFQAAEILKPWWKIEGAVPGDYDVLLGTEAARILNLQTGDHVKIKGSTFLVSGVLAPTGSQDDQLVFARLDTAQSLLHKEGRVSMVEVAALCTACPIEAMVSQISRALPGTKVMAIQQVVQGRMETLSHFRKFSYGVSVILVLVGSLVVLVTMMGSVRERTAEIGIFRAMGFRRSHVMQIVLLEAGILATLAGIMGYFAGFGSTKAALPFFNGTSGIDVVFDPILAAGALAAAVLMGLIASIYPALLAARIDPTDALRAL